MPPTFFDDLAVPAEEREEEHTTKSIFLGIQHCPNKHNKTQQQRQIDSSSPRVWAPLHPTPYPKPCANSNSQSHEP